MVNTQSINYEKEDNQDIFVNIFINRLIYSGFKRTNHAVEIEKRKILL